jgi:hypothetical protein
LTMKDHRVAARHGLDLIDTNQAAAAGGPRQVSRLASLERLFQRPDFGHAVSDIKNQLA